VAVGITKFGATLHEIVAGALQLNPICWANPTFELTLIPYVALLPAGTEGVAESEEIWNGGWRIPVPVVVITCGLPEPLSFSVTVPMLAMAAEGAKST
jgi:hypothetical protein